VSIAAIAFETDGRHAGDDENGLIIRVNQAFTRLTGYSAGKRLVKIRPCSSPIARIWSFTSACGQACAKTMLAR